MSAATECRDGCGEWGVWEGGEESALGAHHQINSPGTRNREKLNVNTIGAREKYWVSGTFVDFQSKGSLHC